LQFRQDDLLSAQKRTVARLSEMTTYRTSIQEELGRLERAQKAGIVLADLKVTHCPACDRPIPPADFWYDQARHEWVIVLKGAARLQFEDEVLEMTLGSFVNIPAHKKHRVDWTTPDEPTVWLGVRYNVVQEAIG
jgi:mannose-6-phosphate isomerase-like protein (cupin superfamily)